jgi:hypothetical protein
MAAAAHKDLLIFKANPGGCSFERHAAAMRAYELDPLDPTGQLYGAGFVPPRSDGKKTHALQEALAAEKWDFVTIQQVSNQSYQFETFEPHAGALIECIRKHAPQAEILIHQTWAYREDYPGFADGAFTQRMMFDGLVESYGKLGEAYGLKVIPVGTAIQKARGLPRWSFQFPDPDFNYQVPLEGTMPNQTGSLMVGWTVKKMMKPKEMTEMTVAAANHGVEPEKVETPVATLDFKHCNPEGRFLGAAVFYGFLFGEKAAANPFVPPTVAPEDAVVLKMIADEVLAQ